MSKLSEEAGGGCYIIAYQGCCCCALVPGVRCAPRRCCRVALRRGAPVPTRRAATTQDVPCRAAPCRAAPRAAFERFIAIGVTVIYP